MRPNTRYTPKKGDRVWAIHHTSAGPTELRGTIVTDPDTYGVVVVCFDAGFSQQFLNDDPEMLWPMSTLELMAEALSDEPLCRPVPRRETGPTDDLEEVRQVWQLRQGSDNAHASDDELGSNMTGPQAYYSEEWDDEIYKRILRLTGGGPTVRIGDWNFGSPYPDVNKLYPGAWATYRASIDGQPIYDRLPNTSASLISPAGILRWPELLEFLRRYQILDDISAV